MHDAHDAPTIICDHALQRERPIKLLVHHSDRTWSAMCGADDHGDIDDVEVIHLSHIFEWQPELESLAARLSPGQLADHTETGWNIAFHDD